MALVRVVERDAAALREHALDLLGERIVGARPAHRERRQPQRCALALGVRRGARRVALAPQLVVRGDSQHASLAPRLQALRAQHHVERLVPRDAVEPQRDLSLHVVADRDVEAAHLGEQSEHAVHVGVLQVQGDGPGRRRGARRPGEREHHEHDDRPGQAAHRPGSDAPGSARTMSSSASGSRMRSLPRSIAITTPPRRPTGVPTPTM